MADAQFGQAIADLGRFLEFQIGVENGAVPVVLSPAKGKESNDDTDN